MKNYLFFLVLLSIGISVQGQNFLENLEAVEPNKGQIKISQDENISVLLLARIDEIKKEHTIPGYRIQIFQDGSQSSREMAMQARSKYYGKFGYPCYYVYDPPDSKLYVGDFRNKSEAYKALKSIKRDFPKAFITPPIRINLPDLD